MSEESFWAGAAHAREEMTPVWTRERPTVPGWYWISWLNDDDRPEFDVVSPNTFAHWIEEFGFNPHAYRWAGPLSPPPMPEEKP